jgi:hypothetical protein
MSSLPTRQTDLDATKQLSFKVSPFLGTPEDTLDNDGAEVVSKGSLFECHLLTPDRVA